MTCNETYFNDKNVDVVVFSYMQAMTLLTINAIAELLPYIDLELEYHKAESTHYTELKENY